jgi:hypothetical protein
MIRTPQNDAELKSAIQAAEAGDVITLAASKTFIGPFSLPPKTGPVTITTDATLPDWRIAPVNAALLPTLVTSNAVTAVIEGFGAKHWILDGLRIAGHDLGEGEVIALQDADDITMKRLNVTGSEKGAKRGIRGNGTAITLTKSYLHNIFKPGQESQGFAAWDGAGPYTITDNHIEAASINILFGGSNSASAERMPADITIEGNTLRKPLEWVGKGYAVKNCLELKQAVRFTIRNNLLENTWMDGQGGVLFLLSVHNDDGGSPWAVVRDGLIEKNILRNGVHAFGIVGRDSYHVSAQGTNVIIQDNLCEQIKDQFMRLADDWNVLTVRRNTCDNPGYGLMMWGAPYACRNLTFLENTLKNTQLAGDGVSFADAIPRYVQVFNGLSTGGTVPQPIPPSDDDLDAAKEQIADLQQKLAVTEGKLATMSSYLANVPTGNSAQVLARYIRNLPV